MKFIPLILAPIMSTLSADTVYDHELLDIDGEKPASPPTKARYYSLSMWHPGADLPGNTRASKNFINLTRTKVLWFVDSPAISLAVRNPDRSLKLKNFAQPSLV